MATVTKREWEHNGKPGQAWRVRYNDANGKQHTRQFKLKKDADAYRRRVENELEIGIHTPRRLSVTVEAAAEAMLEGSKNTLRPEAQMAAEYYVKRFLVPLIGGVLLVDLNSIVVQDLVDRMLSPKICGYTDATERTLWVLRRTIKYALPKGWVNRNVISECPPQFKRHQRKRTNIPSLDELKRILAAAEGRAKPILYTAAFTGCRPSELRGLEWLDVDFDKQVIHVRRSRDRWGNVNPPKSEASKRIIHMAPVLVATLREWKIASKPNDLGLVFATRNGQPMSPAVFAQQWAKTLYKVGMAERIEYPHCAPHSRPTINYGRGKFRLYCLRHVAASLMIEFGASPKFLQEFMGHKYIKTTFDIYGHLFIDSGEAERAALHMQDRLGLG